MDKKIIVSGRPRSGTSLMMRILDVSGYRCVRDWKWERKIGKKINNPYFYESKNITHGNSISFDGYDAAKVFVNGLSQVYDYNKYFVIWMDRNKESMFQSWNSYNRADLAKVSNEEDYSRFNETKILQNFDHIRVNYDNLIDNPKNTLEEISKAVNININVSINQINSNLRHF